MSMNALYPSRLICLLALLLLVLVAAVAPGCSKDTSAATTTTAATTATSETGGSTTSTSTPKLTQWQEELAKPSLIENKLAGILQAAQVAQNDPRRGLIEGLRARTLALSCRQALADKDLKLADSTMLQVYQTLNMSRGVATGAVAQTIESARTIINGIGAPSDGPDKAAPLLEKFITATASLLDAATAEIASTPST